MSFTALGAPEHLRFDLGGSTPVMLWTFRFRRPRPLIHDIHQALELGVVLSGRILRRYEGSESRLSPGDGWLCASWEPHGGAVLAPDTRLLVAVLSPAWVAASRLASAPSLDLTAAFARPPAHRICRSDATRRNLLDWARRTARLAGDAAASPAHAARRELALLEGLVLAGEGPPQGRRPAPDNHGRLAPALDRVEDSAARVDVADAARACGLSRSQFDRIFRARLGTSFARFCLRRRLAAAADALRSTSLPIKAIAAEHGFTDASHLHRHFVAAFRCSPATYRTRH